MNEFIKKPVFKTVVYYIIVISLIVFFNISGDFKTGPCNPGLDLISVLLAVIITFVLLVINVFLSIRKGKVYLPSLCIHLLVLVLLIIFSIV